jgi:hypothetical protein
VIRAAMDSRVSAISFAFAFMPSLLEEFRHQVIQNKCRLKTSSGWPWDFALNAASESCDSIPPCPSGWCALERTTPDARRILTATVIR